MRKELCLLLIIVRLLFNHGTPVVPQF